VEWRLRPRARSRSHPITYHAHGHYFILHPSALILFNPASTTHDSASLCRYPLNFVNFSRVREAAGGDCAGNPAANEHVKPERVLSSAFWTELPGCFHPERSSV
jgi:hypothetical protein